MIQDHMMIPMGFSMDKCVNSSGEKLLDICLSSDLKIVNGRIGDDAGVGSYTYLSTRGYSLIDYVLLSYDYFYTVKDFIVHDLFTCLPHVPIQIDRHVSMNSEPSNNENDDK